MRPAALLLVLSLAAPGAAGAEDSCLVTGRVLGHDGSPIPKVVVRPIAPRARSSIPGRDGRFSVKLPCGAARALAVEGVHHQGLMLPAIPAAGGLEVEVRLRAQAWADRIDSVRVIRESDGYAIERAIPMSRRRDGTFAATVPCESESLRYQLLGVAKDGLPTAGTMADTFFLRGSSSIASMRAGRKAVEVVFDPKRLPRSRSQARVRFSDPRSASAVVYPLFREDREEEARIGTAHAAHLAAGGDPDSFRWDWSAYPNTLVRRIAAEPDPLRRQFLLLCHLRRPGGNPDTALVLRALEEVPPDSPLWGLSPSGPASPLWAAGRVTRRPDVVRAYAEHGSERHPDLETRAGFLMAAIHEANETGDQAGVGRYVTRMLDEFGGTRYAEDARKRFSPSRATRPGQPSPEAAFTGLEDSTRVMRVSDFRGRHLLLDFWAVWCGPCRFEMPGLHRAWEGFKDRGLQVLSVSFDDRREDVAKYRKEKWSMPWLHAFARGGPAAPEAAAFEVIAIPKPVLIGPDGVIVAEGDELRGEKLHATLGRLLGEPAKPAGGRE